MVCIVQTGSGFSDGQILLEVHGRKVADCHVLDFPCCDVTEVRGTVHSILEMGLGSDVLEHIMRIDRKVIVTLEGHPEGDDEVHLTAFPGPVQTGVDDALNEPPTTQPSCS